MKVRIRFFASLREAAGYSETGLELSAGATVEECRKVLANGLPALAKKPGLQAAVNRRYATFDTELREDDEVVFIPPVSGG